MEFHESIPLPKDAVEIALGGARRRLWLGVLNRGLQPAKGQLARLLAQHPELQEWEKCPCHALGSEEDGGYE